MAETDSFAPTPEQVSGDSPANSPKASPAKPVPAPTARIEALGGDPNFMTSLARGLAVIQAFSDRKRQATISQISQKTGFSRAAVRRCLYTLSKLGSSFSRGCWRSAIPTFRRCRWRPPPSRFSST